MHTKALFWIHRRHHEFEITVSYAGEYSHPIEHILNNIAAGIGFRILSSFTEVHLLTILVWLTYRVISAIEGHSGYEWSWRMSRLIPLGAGPKHHNYHHSHKKGNYGSMTRFWDVLFGQS